ncbi:MAG: nuclear transport factor 2 family protein [Acidimicrobiia bacterium]
MNVDDLLAREAIRHTLNSYHIAGDSNDAEGYAAVFTEDGVVRAGGFEIAGREQLREWKAARTKALTATFVRHNLTTCKIDLTGPDSAKGRAYFFVVTDAGPDHCGTYDDIYRKVGDQWLIASRDVDTHWHSPTSRFRPQPSS